MAEVVRWSWHLGVALATGTWYLLLVTQNLAPGIWHLVSGTWSLVLGTCYPESGTRYVVSGTWFLVLGT